MQTKLNKGVQIRANDREILDTLNQHKKDDVSKGTAIGICNESGDIYRHVAVGEDERAAIVAGLSLLELTDTALPPPGYTAIFG